MPVVGSSNSGNDVTEALLCMIRRDADAAHKGPCGAPKIMKRPVAHGADLVKPCLKSAEPADRMRPIRTEGKFAIFKLLELAEIVAPLR